MLNTEKLNTENFFSMSALKVHNLYRYFGNLQAVNGVSFEVPHGSVCGFVGANGAGKTTTLRNISGLVPATRGQIRFNGESIERASPEKIVKMGIAHVPEGRRIFPGLTVKENIMIGSSPRGHVAKRALEAEVEEMYAIFPDLKRLSSALGWSLSGGQQQMLAVARGLMSKPKLILLDEPSLGLAPIIVQQLFATIRTIRERGTTVLLVEQNANMALSVADRGYVLSTGRVIVEGTPSALLNNEEVRAAYLGGGKAPAPAAG